MATQQQRPTLLGIAPELRNKIWTLAFVHNDIAIDLSNPKGPNRALLATCRQIRNEALDIYDHVLEQYWPTGRFELHCDTSEEQIQQISDAKLKQITRLKMYGRSESYIFASGAWTCTQLCRAGIADDGIGLQVRQMVGEPCPNGAVFQANPNKRTTVRQLGWYTPCPGSCLPGCQGHVFRCFGVVVDLEKAQEEMGWNGLTKRELDGMLKWYKRVVKHREAYMGSLLIDFDSDEWKNIPELN